ncbi:hypothetical protein PENSPDRAFT_671477 [Peniophora sp. CONT]|nr:hypothetical protein PENSPDRAFT_671477 [Peniophora sp. CONT]
MPPRKRGGTGNSARNAKRSKVDADEEEEVVSSSDLTSPGAIDSVEEDLSHKPVVSKDDAIASPAQGSDHTPSFFGAAPNCSAIDSGARTGTQTLGEPAAAAPTASSGLQTFFPTTHHGKVAEEPKDTKKGKKKKGKALERHDSEDAATKKPENKDLRELMPGISRPTNSAFDQEMRLNEVMVVTLDNKDVKVVQTCRIEGMFPRKVQAQARLKALIKGQGNFPTAVNLYTVDPLRMDKSDGLYFVTPPWPVSPIVFTLFGVVAFNALELSPHAFTKQLGFIPFHDGWARSTAALGEALGLRYMIIRSFHGGIIAQTSDKIVALPDKKSAKDERTGKGKKCATPDDEDGELPDNGDEVSGDDDDPDQDAALASNEDDLSSNEDEQARDALDTQTWVPIRPKNWPVTVFDGRAPFFMSKYHELPQLPLDTLKARTAVAVMCTIGCFKTNDKTAAIVNRNNVRGSLQFHIQSVILLETHDPSSKDSSIGVFQPDLRGVVPDPTLDLKDCINLDRVERAPVPELVPNEQMV